MWTNCTTHFHYSILDMETGVEGHILPICLHCTSAGHSSVWVLGPEELGDELVKFHTMEQASSHMTLCTWHAQFGRIQGPQTYFIQQCSYQHGNRGHPVHNLSWLQLKIMVPWKMSPHNWSSTTHLDNTIHCLCIQHIHFHWILRKFSGCSEQSALEYKSVLSTTQCCTVATSTQCWKCRCTGGAQFTLFPVLGDEVIHVCSTKYSENKKHQFTAWKLRDCH